MKKILTFLFTIFALAGFSQSITVTVGEKAISSSNSDSLGGKAPAFFVDTATAQNIQGIKDFKDVINLTSGLQFVPTTGLSHSEGLIFYDSATKTFSGFIDRADVTLNIGEENWLRVVNKSGGDFTNGQVVYLDSAQGNRPTILLAKANALSTSQGTIAVLTEDIDNNEEGIATTFGLVRSYNTTGFDPGDELYLSPLTAGLITKIKPSAPNFIICLGWALNSTVNGTIIVNINIFGDGTNNTFINQDVTTTGSPIFDTITSDISIIDTLLMNTSGRILFDSTGRIGMGIDTPRYNIEVIKSMEGGAVVDNAASFELIFISGTQSVESNAIAGELSIIGSTILSGGLVDAPAGITGFVTHASTGTVECAFGTVGGFFSSTATPIGTVANAIGSAGLIFHTTTGTLTKASGLVANVQNLGAGTITEAIGLTVLDVINSGGGSVPDAYGLKINDITGGGTNWAIKTGTGAVSFGDAVTTIGLQTSAGLTFPDPGTSVNSALLTMIADNSGTPQTGTININFGANPYMRFSPPNAGGAATVAFDVRSDLMSFQDGFILSTNTSTDDNVIFKAWDNSSTLAEIARFTSGATPTFDLLKGRLTGLFNANSQNIDNIDSVIFDNGASITNPHTDTLTLTETVIRIEGNLSVQGGISITNPHLFLNFFDSIITLAMTVNNWVQVTNASDSLFGIVDIQDFTISADTVIFDKAGHYSITGALTHVGGGGNDIQELRWITDTGQLVKMESSTSNTADHVAVPLPAFIVAEVGTKLWMEIRNITDNDDSTIHSGVIVITLAHF